MGHRTQTPGPQDIHVRPGNWATGTLVINSQYQQIANILKKKKKKKKKKKNHK